MKKLLLICLTLLMALSLWACSSNASPADEPRTIEIETNYLEEGINYWLGLNGAVYDKEKARESFSKAVEQGDPDAYYWLGRIRETDIDPQRKDEILQLYQKGIDEGSPLGKYGMALLYQFGWGVELDSEKARSLFIEAADAGCDFGFIGLGTLYYDGQGVQKDDAKALEYFEKAFESSDPIARMDAQAYIASVYEKSEELKDNEKALQYYTEAAQAGSISAIRSLSNAYLNGTIVEQDNAKACEWFEKEISHGSWYNYGIAFLYGYNGEPDYPKALENFQREIKEGKGAPYAMLAIGYMTTNGLGVESDQQKAVEWYKQVIEAAGPYDYQVVDLAQQWIDYLEPKQ